MITAGVPTALVSSAHCGGHDENYKHDGYGNDDHDYRCIAHSVPLGPEVRLLGKRYPPGYAASGALAVGRWGAAAGVAAPTVIRPLLGRPVHVAGVCSHEMTPLSWDG